MTCFISSISLKKVCLGHYVLAQHVNNNTYNTLDQNNKNRHNSETNTTNKSVPYY